MASDESLEDLFTSGGNPPEESPEDSPDSEPDEDPATQEEHSLEFGGQPLEDAPESQPADTADAGRTSTNQASSVVPETNARGTAPDTSGDRTPDEADQGHTVPIPSTSRLSTGIDGLDACLDGGLPPGRILGILSPPDTQSELLVKFLAANHDCLYLSTLRPKWEVEEEVADFVQRSAVDGGDVADVQIEQLSPDGRLGDAREYIEGLTDASIVVVDSVNELEQAEPARYTRFLDDLKDRLWQNGSVGILYGIESPDPPRGRTITLRRADLVWQLRRSVGPEDIEHQLIMSKFRSGRALSTPINLTLTDDVSIEEPNGENVGTVLEGALDD